MADEHGRETRLEDPHLWAQAARVPLVVGVTGHRDLRPEDRDLLTERVAEVLLRCWDRDGAGRETPLVVVSALAEGADQLVAEVALELGAELVAPLPLPAGHYETDFSTSAALARFHRLRQQASHSFVVPASDASDLRHTDLQDDDWDAIARDDVRRKQQYHRVGRWTVRHAHALIALWDGRPAQGHGGTAEIVELMRGGADTTARLEDALDVADTGPVHHILTPRLGAALPDQPAGTLTELAPEAPVSAAHMPHLVDTWPQRGTATVDLLHAYNQDVTHSTASVFLMAEQSILGDRAALTTPSESLPPVDPLLARRAWSDALAVSFQERRQRALAFITGAGVVAIVCFVIYGTTPTSAMAATWVLANGIVLAAALLTYAYARSRRIESKHLDYRALAEGLRIQLAWRTVGLAGDVADHYMLKQVTDTSWIRMACRVTHGLTIPARARPPDRVSLERVRDWWIRDQAEWFAKKQRELHAILKAHTAEFRGLMTIGVLCSLWIIVAVVSAADGSYTAPVVIVMASAYALASGRKTYVEKRAFAEQERQYEWSTGVFALAWDRLDSHLEGHRLVEARLVLAQVGIEAVEENCLWLLHRRARPLPPPSP